MSEQKHTPGPWVISPLSEMIFSADMGDHQRPIGFIYGPAFAERSEVGRTAMANAVLCAAAPEMLEALIMVRDADEDCKADGLPSIPPAARAKIDTAIAKAEGRQP